MSFITEQIQRIDARLDHTQLTHLGPPTFTTSRTSTHSLQTHSASSLSGLGGTGVPARVLALQTSIRALSPDLTGPTFTSSKVLLKPAHIVSSLRLLLDTSTILGPDSYTSAIGRTLNAGQWGEDQEHEDYNPDNVHLTPDPDSLNTQLEWLLVSKATTQVYGHVVSNILDAAAKLEDEIWYWDEVLGSQSATMMYSVQASPVRLLGWGREVWGDIVVRTGGGLLEGLRKGWKEFYNIASDVVRERSVGEVRRQVLGTVRRLREEVRGKQAVLKTLRVRHANALGVLLGEGLASESVAEEKGRLSAKAAEWGERERWKSAVARSVALMEAVLARINHLETPVERFEAAIAELTEDDALYTAKLSETASDPRIVADRLMRFLIVGLPLYTDSTQALVKEHGRPSRVVRYWLPITVGVLSSSTALRVILNRKAQIVQGVQDLGSTIIDFWTNWVIEPTRNLIKTIRHDEGSEISIMSKRSLEGDRASLERMVVDFAIDNPVTATGSNARLTEIEIADIRARVREGDLTPVLKAYEKDLASPLMGSLRGNLIRALLIQIQKTKVDVEVAMGGIDALLKSQELCIGIIGLTPGLLITYFLLRWVRNSFSEKRGSRAVLKQGKMLRQLRNLDRILTSAKTTEFNELAYKDQGLLICEVHGLRQTGANSMPGEIYREFGEEVDELCDVRIGAEKQQRVVERIRWAYAKWLA